MSIDRKIIELSGIFDSTKSEYNNSDLDGQLKLLEKYFPIGITVEVNRDFTGEMIFTYKSKSAIVTGYKKVGRYYQVVVKGNEPMSAYQLSNLADEPYVMENAHPGALIYTEEEFISFRNRKIDNLIN